MLASPLLVGAIAGGLSWVHLPLAAFWFAGYFAFFATTVWLKARRRSRHLRPVLVHSSVAAALGIVVLVVEPDLLRWAPLFVLPMAVGLWAAAARRERALLAGLTTTIGSCLMAVVAYDAGAGAVDQRAWLLALVQALYFAGTVFYVKSAIRERDNRTFLAASVGYHVAAAVIAGWVAWQLGVVFALLAVRAGVVPPRRPSPKALGIGEIVSTVVVALTSLLAL
jgi:hypothetical protein